eukprot:Opistho-2@66976
MVEHTLGNIPIRIKRHDVNYDQLTNELLYGTDWTEPWLASLIAFHVLTFIAIIATRRSWRLQTFLLISLGGLVLAAQRINELAASTWQSFSLENHFDEHGFFISMVFSLPTLLNLCIVAVFALRDAGSLMVKAKRLQLREQIAKRGNAASAETRKDK